ncbi:MAG: type I methionyl aminopeptidase [Anaerolineales bacterium]|nr:MAG: type I methionyl aminopeptidase [Anaerolineales bacterium]
MTVETDEELKRLQVIGRICAAALRKMLAAAAPGMTTRELDEIGRSYLESQGAQSAPEVMYQFPGATCISVAPVIAHGVPGKYVLQHGDLIHIDVSAEKDGYFADTGASMQVAKGSKEVTALLDATKATLKKTLATAKAGTLISDLGQTMQSEARKRGYNTIAQLASHGIGRKLHEYPSDVLNVPNPRDKRVLTEGLVLALEPFLTAGSGRITEERDGWSLRTTDRSIAAQFEHTIVVTQGKPIILT